MLLRILFSLVLLIGAPYSLACAQDGLSPRQQEILNIAMNTDGFLTTDLHKEFWQSGPAELRSDRAAQQAFRMLMEPLILDGMSFQSEVWASAGLSYRARHVVRTEGYQRLTTRFEQERNEIIRNAVVAKLYKAEDMLKAAASHSAYETNEGRMFVTPELIERVKSGLDSSLVRAQYLFDPAWKPIAREWSLPLAGARILSSFPFKYEMQEINAATGQKVTVHSYQLTMDDKTFVSLSAMVLPQKFDGTDAALVRVAQSGLSAMGVGNATVTTSNFRDGRAALGGGSVRTSEGDYFSSVRVLTSHKDDQLLMVTSVSAVGRIEADINRENMETSLMFD